MGEQLRTFAATRRLGQAVVVAISLATAAAPVAAVIPTGQRVAGIPCDAAEGATLHIHSHLTILDHGRPVGVPEDVGRPLSGQCFYWLHTHTPDGIIHIESPAFREFTLGQFFAIWDQPLTARDIAGAKPRPGERVNVYVDGRPYRGDPRAIEFTQHLDIAIVIGAPYRIPPPFTAWNGN